MAENIYYALVFFISDKTFEVVAIEEVIGWCSAVFERLDQNECVELKCRYDLKDEECIVMQVGHDRVALNKLSSYCAELKAKHKRLEHIMARFNRVQPRNRQRLRPLDNTFTESTTDYSFTMAESAPKRKCLDRSPPPLPCSSSFNVPVTPISCSSPKITTVST